MTSLSKRRFPCPICRAVLDVRDSKKEKPYVLCDPCGMQMFIRGPAGIAKLDSLIAAGDKSNAFDRLEEMERRYRKTCATCDKPFWISPDRAQTSWFDGELTGFKCP